MSLKFKKKIFFRKLLETRGSITYKSMFNYKTVIRPIYEELPFEQKLKICFRLWLINKSLDSTPF